MGAGWSWSFWSSPPSSGLFHDDEPLLHIYQELRPPSSREELEEMKAMERAIPPRAEEGGAAGIIALP